MIYGLVYKNFKEQWKMAITIFQSQQWPSDQHAKT